MTPVVIVEGFEEGAPVVLRGIVRRTEASDEDGEAQQEQAAAATFLVGGVPVK